MTVYILPLNVVKKYLNFSSSVQYHALIVKSVVQDNYKIGISKQPTDAFETKNPIFCNEPLQ